MLLILCDIIPPKKFQETDSKWQQELQLQILLQQ